MKYNGDDIKGKYEDDTTEFKKEISDNKDRIKRTICAFTNGFKKGHLYIGVAEEKNDNPSLPGKAKKIAKIKKKDIPIIKQTISALASGITPLPRLEFNEDPKGFVRVDIKPSYEISEIIRKGTFYQVWIRAGHENKQLNSYKEKERVVQQKSIYRGYEILQMFENSFFGEKKPKITKEMIELFFPEIEDCMKKLFLIYGDQIIGIFQKWSIIRAQLDKCQRGASINTSNQIAEGMSNLFHRIQRLLDQ